MATEQRPDVVGQYTPPKALTGADHAQGFALALTDGLQQLKEKWGVRDYSGVKIRYTADITVTNPGTIDTYFATLSA